jgi:hypothetical protein
MNRHPSACPYHRGRYAGRRYEVATIIAAPIMLSVDSLGNDPGALQSAFDRFTLWGEYIRGAFFALSFVCTVWALTMTSRDLARARTGQFQRTDHRHPIPRGPSAAPSIPERKRNGERRQHD